MLGSFTGGENSMQKGSRVQFHISPVKSGLVSAVAKGISVLHRIHICVGRGEVLDRNLSPSSDQRPCRMTHRAQESTTVTLTSHNKEHSPGAARGK